MIQLKNDEIENLNKDMLNEELKHINNYIVHYDKMFTYIIFILITISIALIQSTSFENMGYSLLSITLFTIIFGFIANKNTMKYKRKVMDRIKDSSK